MDPTANLFMETQVGRKLPDLDTLTPLLPEEKPIDGKVLTRFLADTVKYLSLEVR